MLAGSGTSESSEAVKVDSLFVVADELSRKSPAVVENATPGFPPGVPVNGPIARSNAYALNAAAFGAGSPVPHRRSQNQRIGESVFRAAARHPSVRWCLAACELAFPSGDSHSPRRPLAEQHGAEAKGARPRLGAVSGDAKNACDAFKASRVRAGLKTGC